MNLSPFGVKLQRKHHPFQPFRILKFINPLFCHVTIKTFIHIFTPSLKENLPIPFFPMHYLPFLSRDIESNRSFIYPSSNCYAYTLYCHSFNVLSPFLHVLFIVELITRSTDTTMN